ncbi:MAG: hypothetical protein WAN36_13470, partial [Calditrichia bacterium]
MKRFNFNFVVLLLISIMVFFIAGQQSGSAQLAGSFPKGRYTPHGYIDNPWHSMAMNRSGVIRSVPPLGFGYWHRSFKGSYKAGPRGHVNYLSLLQMGVLINGKPFAERGDFEKNGIQLYSAYHTKNVMSYDWNYQQVNFSFQYFLPRENSLACRVVLENNSPEEKEVILNAAHLYGLWEIEWWGSNGLSSQYLAEPDVSISKIWAYGDVFGLASDWQTAASGATASENQKQDWLGGRAGRFSKNASVRNDGPIYSLQRYQVILPPHSQLSGFIYLIRGKTEAGVLSELQAARKEIASQLKRLLAEDEKFWSECPQLSGDWPANWKHGWVYDWETLRMNIRQPIGIFKHPWDAMQVHSPRLVLGETALDMMMMSYADPALAKEVIYGTFADALAPNVPCAREDGSVNMIGADGSECGTAPMWGFPFHVIQSIYAATGDSVWITHLYPYLKAYLDWWL